MLHYAHVRRSNNDLAAEDADKALEGLVLDEESLWVSTMVVGDPGQSKEEALADRTAVGRKTWGTFGCDMRGEIRAGLLTAFHEVEQPDEDTIVLRWSRVSKRNGFKERTYRRVHMQGQTWVSNTAGAEEAEEGPDQQVHVVFQQDRDEKGGHSDPRVIGVHWTEEGALGRIGELEASLSPQHGYDPYVSRQAFTVED
ncbi:hypothetical protein ACIRPQ_29370 [Streptomyces sp. NPDC101213]|uniref:hypothetical protein n=1 Tax=Streptomyces sp. NPDC101213 TaxID=3366130 RepID=UPI00382A9063